MNPASPLNMTAIHRAREVDGYKLVEYRPGLLHALPEEIATGRPSLSHDRVVAHLDGIAEAEVENFILWCFFQDRKRRDA